MSMTDNTPDANGAASGMNLGAIKDRVGQVGGGFDRKQKSTMAFVFVGTIGAVLAFSFLSTRTDWAPLMTNLSAEDAAAVTAQLTAKGTEYQLADGGATIQVPKDLVYQSRVDIASVQMPTSGKVGYGILDNQSMTSSEFTQRVGFQRAMEGELGKTIESIDGVTAATVHLAIPKNDSFALDPQKASASVMVKTSKGVTLASRQVQAIVNLVAGGIEGLAPGDVTVADGAGNVLAAPGHAAGAGGDGNEMQTRYETSLANSIEAMLATVVGPGKAKATVTADMDLNSSTAVSETYAPPTTIAGTTGLSVNETTKTETYGSGAAGATTNGVLGPTGTPNAGTGTANGGYQLNERQVNNAVNKVVENTIRQPGAIKQLSVAVVVDEKSVSADQLPEIQRLVSAAAGVQATRGDTVAVSRFALDTSVSKQMKADLATQEKALAAAGDAGVPIWAMGAAGGVILLLVAMLFLGSRKRKQSQSDAEASMYPLQLPAGATNPPGQIINIQATPRASGQSSDQVLAGVGAAAVGGGAQPNVERREVLGTLIDNQPDEVAQLLRSWLGDRREVTR